MQVLAAAAVPSVPSWVVVSSLFMQLHIFMSILYSSASRKAFPGLPVRKK